MIAARVRTARADGPAFRVVLIVLVAACGGQPAIAQSAAPGRQPIIRHAAGGDGLPRDLKFTHLTTKNGLAQDNVVAILQDRQGFMWFGTGEGLNRYDGHSFVVYRNDPKDPGSLSHNFIRTVFEDAQGYLWVAAYPGINRFDPRTERTTRYFHDPKNPKSFSGDSLASVTADSRGHLWFATLDSGLDRFDPATETFTNYRINSAGQFVGSVRRVIEDKRGEIWFVGDGGLFHVNVQTGQVTGPASIITGLAVYDVYEDSHDDFWLLASSPIVGLVKYNRQTKRFTEYPLGAGATLLDGSTLLADGPNGFWVASSLGLSYFDRRTERFARLFQHARTEPDSLSDNSVISIYRDRSGLLWVGTANGGVNILDLRQRQFSHYTHRPEEPESLSPGKVNALQEDSDGVLWVGSFPRALDRLDRKSGRITHYVPGVDSRDSLSKGTEVNSILKDARGYLWVGGQGAGLDRFDERTGRFKHYGHDPRDPGSLMTNEVICVYEDPRGGLWVGQFGGVSHFDPATERFANYRLGPSASEDLPFSVSAIHRDRSGTLWFGTWGGILSRFDDKTKTFVHYTPSLSDPRKLRGGSIGAIHEDRAGALWLASGMGLYRFNRQSEVVTRYTVADGLPSNDLRGILEDADGRLWISSKKGLSRFDPQTERFKNYDVSDGLRSNDFSRSCCQRGRAGEMFFCGNGGVTAFFPEDIGDSPFVPPVVLTSFKIFSKPVRIGADSVLKKAIPYADSLRLSYRANVISFEFAALSYANSHKNRYRYRLEGLDPGWNEVDSTQRQVMYTNLDPGRYVFRVQGSNSDGVWNEAGVSLPIVITPPWYQTNLFRASSVGLFLALMWVAYQARMRQVQHAFARTVEARDIAMASDVQRRLLPDLPPRIDYADFAAVSVPARRIGGDYYDFVELGDGRIGIALADVSGKGVAAALIMSVVQASLRIISSEGDLPPPCLVARMNEYVYRSTPGNKYATFFYALLHVQRRQLRYVNAGHNAPYLLRAGRRSIADSGSPEIEQLSVGGTVVGMFPEMVYEEATVELCSGDVLLAFTDGVPEAHNPEDEEFGEERLQELLRQTAHLPANEISARLSDEMKDWIRDAEQYDDLTFIVMKVR
jgi:serine phosphatase RsbU (regulator of sigma subunit)/ligand-binding sensor domain-containing protein